MLIWTRVIYRERIRNNSNICCVIRSTYCIAYNGCDIIDIDNQKYSIFNPMYIQISGKATAATFRNRYWRHIGLTVRFILHQEGRKPISTFVDKGYVKSTISTFIGAEGNWDIIFHFHTRHYLRSIAKSMSVRGWKINYSNEPSAIYGDHFVTYNSSGLTRTNLGIYRFGIYGVYYFYIS